MIDSYFTIREKATIELKIQASIFKATAIHVSSIDAAEQFLTAIRKTDYDANHNCYAFLIDPDHYRFSDDGEPNHSAGKPIFDVLKGSGLLETIIVVTRYFGGTKLGVGGLVRAYSDAAKLVLDKSDRREVILTDRFDIYYAYDDTNIIMHELQKVNGTIIKNTYTDKASMQVNIRQSMSEQFHKQIVSASNGRVKISK